MKYWVVNQEKTMSHWVEVADPEGWYYAIIKWDGCVYFDRHFNFPRGSNDEMAYVDSIHICDLDDHIRRLLELRKIAKNHFGKEWK